MEALGFVNECGDKYTQIPSYFVLDIKTASGQIIFVVLGTVVMTIMSFVAMIVCVAGGKSKDYDEDEHSKGHDYEPLSQ